MKNDSFGFHTFDIAALLCYHLNKKEGRKVA